MQWLKEAIWIKWKDKNTMNKNDGEYVLNKTYNYVHSPVCNTASFDVWNEQAISWFAIPGSCKKIKDKNKCVNQSVPYNFTDLSWVHTKTQKCFSKFSHMGIPVFDIMSIYPIDQYPNAIPGVILLHKLEKVQLQKHFTLMTHDYIGHLQLLCMSVLSWAVETLQLTAQHWKYAINPA